MTYFLESVLVFLAASFTLSAYFLRERMASDVFAAALASDATAALAAAAYDDPAVLGLLIALTAFFMSFEADLAADFVLLEEEELLLEGASFVNFLL